MTTNVTLDLSGTDNGTAPVTVNDGIESVEYKPSKGKLTVRKEHIGAVLGAIPGAVLLEGETTDAGTAGDDSTKGTPA